MTEENEDEGPQVLSTRNVYILSTDECDFTIEEAGDFNITLNTVSGLYNTPLLAKGDYVDYIDVNGVSQRYTQMFPIDYSLTCPSVAAMFPGIVSYHEGFGRFQFLVKITDCSPRFKYVFGIRDDLPVGVNTFSKFIPSTVGSPCLCVECKNIAGFSSINTNMFNLGSTFELQGGAWSANGNNLSHVLFGITGYYGEKLEVYGELLWSFTLEKVKYKDGQHSNTHTTATLVNTMR